MKCADGYISPIPLNKHYIYLLRFIRLFDLIIVDTQTHTHAHNYAPFDKLQAYALMFSLLVCFCAREYVFLSLYFSHIDLTACWINTHTNTSTDRKSKQVLIRFYLLLSILIIIIYPIIFLLYLFFAFILFNHLCCCCCYFFRFVSFLFFV